MKMKNSKSNNELYQHYYNQKIKKYMRCLYQVVWIKKNKFHWNDVDQSLKLSSKVYFNYGSKKLLKISQIK